MDHFVTHDKIIPLVQELLTAEVWKHKIFPLLKGHMAELSSIKSYVCLYHEASIVNLLEVMLYHRTACENSEDALVEVIDYCYRKFVELTNKADYYEKRQKEASKEDPKDYLTMTKEKELEKNLNDIEFQSAMICFSIVRFISDHLGELSVPVVHQMIENNDMPCILVPLLEIKPWFRKNAKGETELFEDQRWEVVKKENSSKLPKIEAQIWLTIYNMFTTQETNRKYEITSFRK